MSEVKFKVRSRSGQVYLISYAHIYHNGFQMTSNFKGTSSETLLLYSFILELIEGIEALDFELVCAHKKKKFIRTE